MATVAPETITAARRSASSAGSHRRPIRPRDFLSVPVYDEQGIVDGDAEADQEDEIRHVRRRHEPVRRDEDEAERPEDRAGREEQRDRHGQRQPEDDQQHCERDRDRDQLAALEVLAEDRSRSAWIAAAP
jgi:hypothetical protein